MPATHDEEFKRLSALCRMHLKAGMLDWYAFDLKSMAALLGREGKHIDKLKVLMVAFYIDLSGVGMAPFIDDALVASLEEAAHQSGLNKHQIDELYLEAVRADTTPSHVMTVSDSRYILELSLSGRKDEADEILTGMAESRLTSLGKVVE